MKLNIITTSFSLIFTEDILSKIKINEDKESIRYQIDLHGFTKKQAYFVITTIIKLTRNDFTLDLIHGFNHGTVLKTMIYQDIQHPRIRKKYCNPWNPGETFIELSAA